MFISAMLAAALVYDASELRDAYQDCASGLNRQNWPAIKLVLDRENPLVTQALKDDITVENPPSMVMVELCRKELIRAMEESKNENH